MLRLPSELLMAWGVVNWYEGAEGVIAWRPGTGLNVELLYVKADSEGKGNGRALLRVMLKELAAHPPYWTVFGFTRTINKDAQAWYKAMGFDLSPVKGVYKDGNAVLFSQSYEVLRRIHLNGAQHP